MHRHSVVEVEMDTCMVSQVVVEVICSNKLGVVEEMGTCMVVVVEKGTCKEEEVTCTCKPVVEEMGICRASQVVVVVGTCTCKPVVVVICICKLEVGVMGTCRAMIACAV